MQMKTYQLFIRQKGMETDIIDPLDTADLGVMNGTIKLKERSTK